MAAKAESLPHLRFDVDEATRILRISRAGFYERVKRGEISPQKDGKRTFITAAELERYVASKSP